MGRFVNRGISAANLLELVHNTAPFLFAPDPLLPLSPKPAQQARTSAHQYWWTLLEAEKNPSAFEANLRDYYHLCLSAHFATVGTFVPTDVDHAIRIKLFKDVHNESALTDLWNCIQDFALWDESPVSKRFVELQNDGKIRRLSGHSGEWFSIAAGAYATALRLRSALAQEIASSIRAEVARHRDFLVACRAAFQRDADLMSAQNYFFAMTIVAHNLGDLDRVLSECKVPDEDFLLRQVYRLGHADSRAGDAEFILAGNLNKKFMAAEAHRHLPLREAKCLRRSRKFLLGFGPFLDDWGGEVISSSRNLFDERDDRDFFQALIEGWMRLNVRSTFETVGYARALVGAAKQYPGGMRGIIRLLPPALSKVLTDGGLRSVVSVPREQFEKDWVGRLASAVKFEG